MRNPCLFMLSARDYLLKKCLTCIDQNYNKRYNYPIVIFYHGNRYDSEQVREEIRSINRDTEVRFRSIECKIPDHLEEKDMFWNLPNNNYARSFGRSRLGYLHAISFLSNFMEHPDLQEFDYVLRLDDDAWFKKEIPFDFFEELDKNNGYFGTGFTWNSFGPNHLETRHNLFNWVKDYVVKYDIDVKNEQLKCSLNGPDDNIMFHTLDWNCGNCNVINRKMFETEEWRRYISEVKKSGGAYKYRWGDCEIIGLYAYLHLDNPLVNFNIREKGLYEPQIPNTQMVFNGVK